MTKRNNFQVKIRFEDKLVYDERFDKVTDLENIVKTLKRKFG